jgi:predicted transcriptional regulator
MEEKRQITWDTLVHFGGGTARQVYEAAQLDTKPKVTAVRLYRMLQEGTVTRERKDGEWVYSAVHEAAAVEDKSEAPAVEDKSEAQAVEDKSEAPPTAVEEEREAPAVEVEDPILVAIASGARARIPNAEKHAMRLVALAASGALRRDVSDWLVELADAL